MVLCCLLLVSDSVLYSCRLQARRHVFKSGPAEIQSEWRRHERGRAREGVCPPLVMGGSGGHTLKSTLI